jgi:uncharacterized protein YjbJ (UPF0337 family)
MNKNIWQGFTDKAKKLWRSLRGSNAPEVVQRREVTTNIKWNHVSGQWGQFYHQAREQWSKLTESELIEVNGHYEVLARKIQEKYSIDRAEAKQQIDLWTANLHI